MLIIVSVVAVLLIAGVAGAAWMFLRPDGDGPGSLASATDRPSRSKPSETAKTVEAVKLRQITGDQLCAAVPDALRKSLVTDGRYGGRDASTPAATDQEKRASCSWSNSKMTLSDGRIGYRKLSVSVQARNSETQGAAEYAKSQFDRDKEAHERRVNVKDGNRTDGRTSGSAFGELKSLDHGDASYLQTSIGHSGMSADVFVLQGPWLIKVGYGGDNRTGTKYPTGDEVREAADKVSAAIVAEMAKDGGAAKPTGPCAVLTVKQVESAFFPSAQGPSVGGADGRIKQTSCAWTVKEEVEHKPGEKFTSRGGTLTIHVVDWGGGSTGSTFQFDRDAKKYDRYRAQGGIGNQITHTTYEPRKELTGLGEKAFAVISATTRPDKPEQPATQEVLVKVLSGDRTIELVFRGTTTGGGLVAGPGYQEPAFEPTAAQSAVTELAKTFLAGLK